MDLTLEKKPKKCLFCGSKKKDEVLFGPFYRVGNITAHYYCVLLSNKMTQRGSDDEGMLGFLLPDIKKELIRSQNILCCYCKEGHATLKCCHSKCKKIYHYRCGHKNGALFQFFGQFKNYCSKHKPHQIIPKEILSFFQQTITICSICHEDISSNCLNHVLWAPCCKKTWFHRLCIQKQALSAGYLFKCAICNDMKKFRDSMLRLGIYIPDKDASWELEPNAFEDLLFRYNRCDADKCKCPDGRQKDLEDTIWEIVLCQSCGSQGIHKACGRLKFSDPEWYCNVCEKTWNQEKIPSKENVNLDSSLLGNERKEENVQPIPGSSAADIKTCSQVHASGRKRKISDTSENSTLYKRKRYDIGHDSLENEILDIETVDAFNITGSTDTAKESALRSLICNKVERGKLSEFVYNEDSEMSNSSMADLTINLPEIDDKIIIISSDSECEVVEVVNVDTSSDEIEVIRGTNRVRYDEDMVVERSNSDHCMKFLNAIRRVKPIGTYGRGKSYVTQYRTSNHDIKEENFSHVTSGSSCKAKKKTKTKRSVKRYRKTSQSRHKKENRERMNDNKLGSTTTGARRRHSKTAGS